MSKTVVLSWDWRTGGSVFGSYDDMEYWYERYPQYDFSAKPEFVLYDMESQTALLRGKGRALGFYKGYLVIWDEKELAFFDYENRKQYRLDISGYFGDPETPSQLYEPRVTKTFADQTIIGIFNSGYAIDLPPIA